MLTHQQLAIWTVGAVCIGIALFCALLITNKDKTSNADKVLLLWLGLLTLPVVNNMYDLWFPGQPLLYPWLNPALNLLHGPLLFLYTTRLTHPEPKANTQLAVHLLPFVAIYFAFVLFAPEQRVMPAPQHLELNQPPPSNLIQYFGLVNLLVFVSYAVASVLRLNKHRVKAPNLFSQNNTFTTLTWVLSLPALFFLLVALNLLNEWLAEPFLTPANAHLYSYSLFVVVLCYFGSRQPSLFSANATSTTSEQDLQPTLEKMESKDSVTKQEMQRVTDFMNSAKPYLDAEFSVYQLAHTLDLPRRELSRILNSGFNKNFFQFINEYRIEAVKARLLEDRENAVTVLDIALECGFKSKSSFNSLFKKYCGMTPTQYRSHVKQQ